MSDWKELCDVRRAAKQKVWLKDDLVPGFFIKLDEFDKIRAVIESADKLANQDDHEQYVNWKALCKALDELGVGE